MRKLLFLLFLTSFSTIFSQSYLSPFEERVFETIKKDSTNYNFFAAMLAIDSTMNQERAYRYQQKVDALIDAFPKDKENERKERKRIKSIYDELHDAFFVKYDENVFFDDIFNNGYYNCVTASALYSYVFDKLDIPYYVKEAPSHVFLIVYPNSYKIYLETTVPGAYGFLEPSESDIKKIVDELISYKLVTSQEVSEKGYSKFYEDYFYGKEFVDKRALIGMQYYNKGLLQYQKDDFNAAVNNLKKAKLYFDSPIVNWVFKEALYSEINSREMNKKGDVELLIDIVESSEFNKDYTAGNLKSSFTKVVENDDNDDEFIEYTLDEFNKVENEDVKLIAQEFFYEYFAREKAKDSELDDALKYAELLLAINNNSKIAKEIIEHVCFKKAVYSNLSQEGLESFESKVVQHPFIKESNRYNIVMVNFYGKIAYDGFNNKDINLGLDHLQNLENILDSTNALGEIDKRMLANLYTKAGNHFYYQSNYKRAYKIYAKGLTYVPSDSDLIKRVGWCKEEF